MIGIVRDTWRAVLVLVVGSMLIEIHRRPAPPPVATHVPVQQVWQAPPVWQPAPVQWPQAAAPERPLYRVASALTELADSVIGVVR